MRSSFRRSLAVIAVTVLGVGALGVPVSAAQAETVTVDVFVIGSTSGGVFPVLDEATAGIDAGVEAIAKEGDVEFNITSCDAKGDANAVRQCGQDALEAQPDVVFAGDVGQVPAGLPDTLEDAGIPVFWIVATSARESQGDNAMVPTGNLATFGSPGAGAARADFKKDAVLVTSAASASLLDTTVVAYEADGGSIKAEVDTPFAIPGAPTPDYAPSAQKIVDEDPKVVLFASVDLLQNIRIAGFTGPVFTGEGAVTDPNEQLKSLPDEVTKNYYRTGLNPPFDLKEPFPAVKTFKKALKAAGYTESTDANPYSWNTWVYLHAIASVVEGMSDVTAATLLEELNSSSGIELVTGQTWVPSAPGPTNYPRQSLINYYMTKYIGNGQWKLHKTPNTGIDIPPEVFDDLE